MLLASSPPTLQRRCVVAGGGPAGLMCGYLLARAGVQTMVLEKHADFLRDFRGDTIHPSTLELMRELGLLDELLALPHQKVQRAELEIGDRRLQIADFSHLPVSTPFVAFMPQWDFLSFLARRAGQLPAFDLHMEAEVVAPLRERGRVCGVEVRMPDGPCAIHADLVIAADGRESQLRDAVGLEVRDLGAPMDVMWFELPHQPKEDQAVLGRIANGQALVMLYRGDYWQCALLVAKGGAEAIKREGLAAFRRRVARLARREHADEIRDLDDVKVLDVRVDSLARWHVPGMLFIGDAAHAMSPIGGVGINLAIQDAVAAANLLAEPLRRGTLREEALARVRRRRRFPTWLTQRLQLLVQDRLIAPLLGSTATPPVPRALEWLQRWPWLQRIPARIIGIGVRPEHVRTPKG